MRVQRLGAIVLLIDLIVLLLAMPGRTESRRRDDERVGSALKQAPLMFVQNIGQHDERARFLVRGAEAGLFLTDDALWFTLYDQRPPIDDRRPTMGSSVDLRLSFAGANPRPHLEPFERLATRISYFRGSDPAGWRANVPVWGGVRYRNLYSGIDLELTGAGGRLVPRLVVHSSANPSAVRLRVEGANRLAIEGNSVRAATTVGDLRLPLFQLVMSDGKPIINERQAPVVEGVEVREPFARQDSTRLDAAPASAASLDYSTFLGGGGDDIGRSISVDSAKNSYIVGSTESVDFPTTNPIPPPFNGMRDVLVTKLSASGALLYSTYLGGSGNDEGWGIAVDDTGNIHITGSTNSADFPVERSIQATKGGGSDAFVTKLGPNGDTLIFSTYLGGSGFESGDGIAVDGSGNIGIAGHTTSQQGFPIFPVSQPTFGGGIYDGFVAKLSPDGMTFRYFTYLGGSGDEFESTLALDSAGNAYITGSTNSTNFPTRTPFQSNSLGLKDAFVTKLNAAGEQLYSSYLGGSGDDYGEAIAVSTDGRMSIAIGTNSTDLQRVKPAQNQSGGFWDAYIATINPFSAGPASLIYATYLGGGGYDYAKGIAVDDADNIYVSGNTLSTDFPTVNPVQAVHGSDGQYDAFVTKLDVDDQTFVFSTYLGGGNVDENAGIAVDSQDNMYVTGNTRSTNFPIVKPFQATIHGGRDAFVTKLAPTYTISGRVRTGSGTGVSRITISAGAGQTATTAADGSYTLSGLLAGNYTLAATSQLYIISPKSHAVSLPPAITGQDFTAIPSPVYMALLRTSPPPPPDCDEGEPNDDPVHARLIAIPLQPCTGWLQNEQEGQSDYYRAQLDAGKTISIDLTNIPAGANYDLGLYLDSPNGYDLLAKSKTPGQDDEHIRFTVSKTGRYYIRVQLSIKSKTALNNYVLQVR